MRFNCIAKSLQSFMLVLTHGCLTARWENKGKESTCGSRLWFRLTSLTGRHVGKLYCNWKKKGPKYLLSYRSTLPQAAIVAPPPTKPRTGHQDPAPNPISDLDVAEQVDGGEIGADKDEVFLETVRQNKAIGSG